MSHELFFIPILARALSGPDVQQALADAFATIEQLQHQEGYQEGYRNFQTFLAEVRARWQAAHEQDIRRVMLMRTADAVAETPQWEEILASEIRRHPWLRAENDTLGEVFRPRPRVAVLQLLRDDRQIAELRFETIPGRHTITDIRPGRYALRIDTGLILWEGELTAKDLIWGQAFGGRSLELAAEAGEIQHRPPDTIPVPQAGVTLWLFPGLESGSLEIEVSR